MSYFWGIILSQYFHQMFSCGKAAKLSISVKLVVKQMFITMHFSLVIKILLQERHMLHVWGICLTILLSAMGFSLNRNSKFNYTLHKLSSRHYLLPRPKGKEKYCEVRTVVAKTGFWLNQARAILYTNHRIWKKKSRILYCMSHFRA